jgi:oxygen-independent coproporphyrinogen III oxidase
MLSARLHSTKRLELTRRHFINSYPPFNVTRAAEDDCLSPRRELLLYVHIPFCPTICTYCFYKKFGNPTHDIVDRYLSYLKREITLFAARPTMRETRVRTLYIGGGTPTILSSAQLVDLMEHLRAHVDLDSVEEICCEMMPHEDTVTREKLATLKRLGVTRLSFGVESLNEDILRLHNRPCTRDLYERTYAMARDVDFEKINIDIMSGLAGETWANWTAQIDELLAWAPPSISIYKTEVFYNTTMFAGMRRGHTPPLLISDDEEIRHIRYAHETLQREGGYSVANCLHLVKAPQYGDLHYRLLWEGGELKGLGLSAHSSYDGVLHQNAADLPEYYRSIDEGRLPIKRARRLSARDRLSQSIVYGLKNLAVSRTRFVEQFGVDLADVYRQPIAELVAAGALTLDDEWLRVTPEHYIFTDDVCRQFFLPEYEDMMLAHVSRGAESEPLAKAAI